MDPTELDRAAGEFARNTDLVAWFARVLLWGLIAEVFVEFVFRENKSWREIGLNVLCAVVVAVGVWGETHFGELAAGEAAKIQREADARIAEANERAASANQKAEELRAANLRLEALIQPRRISPEDASELEAVAKEAGARTIRIIVNFTDPEAALLAAQLRDIFNLAKWDSAIVPRTYVDGVKLGVSVDCNWTDDNGNRNFAHKLVEFFQWSCSDEPLNRSRLASLSGGNTAEIERADILIEVGSRLPP